MTTDERKTLQGIFDLLFEIIAAEDLTAARLTACAAHQAVYLLLDPLCGEEFDCLPSSL